MEAREILPYPWNKPIFKNEKGFNYLFFKVILILFMNHQVNYLGRTFKFKKYYFVLLLKIVTQTYIKVNQRHVLPTHKQLHYYFAIFRAIFL